MKRLSVPLDDKLYNEFHTKIPHGLKAAVARSILRVLLKTDSNVIFALAVNEKSPEMFSITGNKKEEVILLPSAEKTISEIVEDINAES